jgi:hypothetical protein
MPDDALPDCEACDKPDLIGPNSEAVFVYKFIRNQQMRSSYSGHLFGLRFEAVVSALEWFYEAGVINDRDEVMWRIWEIDGIACRIGNAKLDQERQARIEAGGK